jgi:NADPH-dependent glutamate synthase beta subunit-like oxidoreductase
VTDVIPPIWTTANTGGFKTGTWRSALPVHYTPPSPCHNACPVSGEVARWIGQVRKGEYYDAWLTLVANNPFPAVTGRVCHHPCESACNRSAYDESLSICRLERFVGDMALRERWEFGSVPINYREEVAVIGGGPSGLAAAYQLRRMGYPVTVFEAREELGGLMRYGIPPYRLPRDILDGEIEQVLDDLCRNHAAVYFAVGAGRTKRLPQVDYSHDWVIDGARYLASVNAGGNFNIGKRTVVIGGGSAAMDVARTARRHGADVTVLSLESRRQMPAQKEEVEEAEEEGIRLQGGAVLQSVKPLASGELELHCIRVNFEPGSRPGKFHVSPVPDSSFVIHADTVITAIGQDPDVAFLSELLCTEDNLVAVDDCQATSLPRVFAGGDVASLDRFVTQAFGMGRRAASGINAQLRDATVLERTGGDAVTPEAINAFYYPRLPRAADRRRNIEMRLADFSEVQLGLSEDEAAAESERCFSCGECILCDNCIVFCPDMAVVRSSNGYTVLGDYCKGCGLCVQECPTGSIALREEMR